MTTRPSDPCRWSDISVDGRVLDAGGVGADAVLVGDVVVRTGLGGRVVAAVAGVGGAVVLEPSFELGPDPDRRGESAR